MNNAKRLLSLVMCVIMLMTLVSGYGFAFDFSRATAATSDIDGTGKLGAQLSTNIADVVVTSKNVLVVDENVGIKGPDEELKYTLTWNNEEYKDIDAMTKVFKNYEAAEYYAVSNGIKNPVILLKKEVSDEININIAAALYSEAYNTMPFIKGEGVDGEWSVNTEFEKLTHTLPKINIGEGVTGKVGLYGFTFTQDVLDIYRSGNLDIEIVNSMVKGDMSNVFDFTNNKTKGENTDKLLIKNLYVAKTKDSGSLINGYVPAFTTIDGIYVDTEIADVAVSKISQAGSETEFVFKNSFVKDNTATLFSFVGDTAAMKNSNKKTVAIVNNTFIGGTNNSGVVKIAPSKYTSLVFNDNYVSTGVDNIQLIESVILSDTFNSSSMNIEINRNVFDGVSDEIAVRVNENTLRKCKINIADNFLTDKYYADITLAKGRTLNATEHGVMNDCYYTAFDGEKVSTHCTPNVDIKSVTASNGKIFLNNETGKIYYMMTEGDASSASFTFNSSNTTYKLYKDINCKTQIAATDIKYNDIDSSKVYYMKNFYTGIDDNFESEVYSLIVVTEKPRSDYFSDVYTSDPLLSNKALFCYVDCGYAADGGIIYLDWQGTEYAFIKDINIFESLENAINYAKNSALENPEIVLMDIGGSNTVTGNWKPTYPASYYTVNYATKPYIGDPTMEADQWKENIGSNAGQFDTQKGITLGTVTLDGNVPAGDYKFYGFAFKGGIKDNTRSTARLNCVNLYFENCYYSFNWSDAFLMSGNSDTNAAKGSTEDYLTFKNCYLNSNGTAARFTTGWQASDILFDGVYFVGGHHTSGETYMKQNTATASFRIINSHFKNFGQNAFHNQANNETIASGEDKLLEFSNNIMNNSYFFSDTIFPAYGKAWSKIIIKNNTIINQKEDMYLFRNISDGSSSVKLEFQVEGNKINCGSDRMPIGSLRTLTNTSYVRNNYVRESYSTDEVTYDGMQLKAMSGSSISLPKADSEDWGKYYIDSEMRGRPTDINKYSFSGENVIVDEENKTITYVVKGDDDAGITKIKNSEKGYTYKINLSHIVSNKYGNRLLLDYVLLGSTEADNKIFTGYMQYIMWIDTDVELNYPIELDLSVCAPDDKSEATPIEYKVKFVKEGPAVDTLTVGGETAEFKDGKYSVVLGGRGSGEKIVATPVMEGSTVAITDANGNPTDTVNISNFESAQYKVSVTYNGITLVLDLDITRGGADLEKFEEVYNKTNAIDPEDWLEGFNRAYQTLRAKMKVVLETGRDSITQAQADAYASQMEQILNDAVSEDEYKVLIKNAKRIKNKDGKYCTPTFKALQTTIENTESKVKTLSTASEYNAVMTNLQKAIDGVCEHTFKTYTHDEGTETCVGHGTKSAKCETKGCEEKDTVAETEKFATGKHTFDKYVYNNDATFEKDGTKTATCTVCKKAKDTVVAENTKLTTIDSSKKFKDVPAKSWYKDYVDYAVTYGLLNGTSKDTFEPTKTITRAEFVQVLANMSGVDTSNNKVTCKFTDVESGAWYASAVKWASEKGIVSGTSDTTFAPTAVITREQMCVMLVGYAAYAKVEVDTSAKVAKFVDDAKISSWAKDAVYACKAAGIVEGKDTGFCPQDTATRAEVAVIVSISHEKYMVG